MNKIIAMDVDEPIANLISWWLQIYNEDYDDDLEKSEILGWDLSEFVKPECGKKIYNYLKDPHLYDGVYPTPLAQAGIKSLREMGHRIVYVTSSTIEQSGRKYQWLKDFGFINGNIADYVEMSDKSLIKADIMFDDGYHNVKDFSGVGVLMTEPWNKNFDWKVRANNWYQFIEIVKGLS